MNSKLPSVVPDANHRISNRDIWKQVQLDLIGKDVQDATTYSYVWMADQMGHIGLGWVSAVLCYWISLIIYPLLPSFLQLSSPFPNILDHTFREAPYFWAVVIGTIAPLLIWAKLEFGYLALARKQAQSFFPLDLHDLQWNVRTALAYFYIGVLWGSATLIDIPWIGFCVFGIVTLLAIWFSLSWLRQKMNLQQADIPALFRLTNFDPSNFIAEQNLNELHDELVNTVNFQTDRKRLVVIAGTDRHAKTQLASGIATEILFNGHSLRYCEYTTFREFLDSNSDDVGFRNLPRWPWKETQALVLDSVAPYLVKQGESVNPLDFAQQIARDLPLDKIPHLQDKNHLLVLVLYHANCDNVQVYHELCNQLKVPQDESLLIQTC